MMNQLLMIQQLIQQVVWQVVQQVIMHPKNMHPKKALHTLTPVTLVPIPMQHWVVGLRVWQI